MNWQKIFAIVTVFAAAILLFSGFNADSSRKNDVILITIEDGRADHFGNCYGYERNTTPNICELSQDGVQYNHTYVQGWFTLQSISSTFTSKNHAELDVLRPNTEKIIFPLSDNHLTLAEKFKEEGYYTSATVYPIQFVREKYNFDQGFNQYNVTDNPKDFINANFSESRNNFLWLHMGWTHCSYLNPPEKFDSWSDNKNISPYSCSSTDLKTERLNYTKNKFDGELRRTDHYIGELIERLKEEGRYEETAIVITADHGTKLGEHGYTGHGPSMKGIPLYPNEVMSHVPLVIKPPNNSPELDKRKMVSNLDIAPTLISLANLDSKMGGIGRDLTETEFSRETVYYPTFSAFRTQKYLYKENPLFFVNRTVNPSETSNFSLEPDLRENLARKLDRLENKRG